MPESLRQPLMRMSEEDFDKVIDVNLKSVFNMTSDSENVLKKRSGSINK
jgi:3-oxoacyl-[acyl-carrier protein] reductase